MTAPKREPVQRLKPTEQGIPWQWGYDAARDGYGAEACPWNVNAPSYAKWHEGHTEGLKAP